MRLIKWKRQSWEIFTKFSAADDAVDDMDSCTNLWRKLEEALQRLFEVRAMECAHYICTYPAACVWRRLFCGIF